jgi:amino acid adenylation domain-containing protein
MKRTDVDDMYPLTPMQQGMLFHTLHEPETHQYVEQSVWTFKGTLNIEMLERAWQLVVDRHPVLRTAVVWEDVEEPMQVVCKNVRLPFIFKALSQEGSPEKHQAALEDLLRADRERGFDLASAPLMRVTVLVREPGVHQCIWTHHHIILDGWSVPILMGELTQIYTSLVRSEPFVLPPVSPFGEYVAWLSDRDPNAARDFWNSALSEFNGPNDLRIARRARPGVFYSGYARCRMMLDQELSEAVHHTCRTLGVTLSTVMQACWGVLVSRYSGDDDVVFGLTVSGRPADLPGAESIVGLCINTIPVRIKPPAHQSIGDWLRLHQQWASAAAQFDYVSLAEIHRWAGPRDGESLFTTLLVVENYPVRASRPDPTQDLEIEPGEAYTRTNYPLTVAISPGETIGVEIGFDRLSVRTETAEAIMRHLADLLRQMTHTPQEMVSSLVLAPESDFTRTDTQRPVVDQSARPPADILVGMHISSLNEPNRPAIVDAERTVTYRALDRSSNQIARVLMRLGVGPESVVAIVPDRSAMTITAILGILKAGGVYLPLDASLPRARIRSLLEESGALLLLCGAIADADDLVLPEQVVSWERLSRLALQEKDTPTQLTYAPESAAYIIYTSGSTGAPKGVVIPRGALAHFASEMARILMLSPEDRVLQFLSFSFDAVGEEIFPALIAGSTIVMHPHPPRSGPADFLQFAKDNAITVAHMPTAFWHVVTEHMNEGNAVVSSTLRRIAVGGESPSTTALGRWMQQANFPSTFMNVYGPTETTIAATQWGVTVHDVPFDTPDPIPIGQPIGEVTVYVLDQKLHPLPVGVTGELHIGGPGVGRGYLRKPDLTAAVFLPDPFASVPGARMYRTGDTGYMQDDGAIVFTGRRDRQCKVRGFRIEPAEVEERLRAIAGVRDAVVIVRDDAQGGRRLVAYVEAPAIPELPVESILSSLRNELPEQLIPSTVVLLEHLPHTSSGKIDHLALPAPGGSEGTTSGNTDPPRGPTEIIIAGIWEELLDVHNVSRQDAFFALGGHSLLAIRLLYRLREAFSLDLVMADVFESLSLADLATRIDVLLRHPALKAPTAPGTVDRSGVIPLSFAQQRLWFLDQLQPGSSVYIIPSVFRVSGPLDTDAFGKALRAIVQRHESLRTSYHVVDGIPSQHIQSPGEAVPDYRYVPWNGDATDEEALHDLITNEIKSPFRLDEGPLLRVRLFQTGGQEHLLLFVIHHSISDGWSIGVLVRELCEAYGAILHTHEWNPRALQYQYADFAVWQRHDLTDERVHVLLEYWREKLQNIPSVSTLPLDHPRPAQPSFSGAIARTSAGVAVSREVKHLARRENATSFMTLLAAFHCALYRYSGQRDLVVGTPIAGRMHAAFDNVIGFFVNTLGIRTRVDPGRSFADVLRSVRDECIGAYSHQDLPFDRLVEELHPVRDLTHAPVFQTVFALQDIPVPDITLPGLKVTGVNVPTVSSGFDMSLEVSESADGYGISCTYNAELYLASTITRFLRHYISLLRSLVQNPDVPVGVIAMLSPDERRELVQTWNQTRVPFEANQTVHGRFAEHVKQQPDAVAVAYCTSSDPEGQKETSLTYQELDTRSTKLSRRLRSEGVRQGDLVGICMERSLDLIISVLGCLKAGAGFIPLDPAYPQERLRYMVNEARPRAILTGGNPGVSGFTGSTPVFDVRDTADSEVTKGEITSAAPVHPEDVAYVIFTSGSTGRPKGTILAHRGLVNLAAAQATSFQITPGDRILQFSSFSFDAAVWEIVMALLNGASLWLTDRDTITNPSALAELIGRKQITIVTLPPSILGAFPTVPLPSLATIVVAGERCPAELVAQWGVGRRFVNAYGPTETTVCASLCICDGSLAGSPPIGRPLQNIRTYIVDGDLQPLPAGVPGELLVGGVSLAYGYLNRPDITADKFIPDPFGSRGGRLYRTGDLCRYLPDGNIDFLGRIDHQVKIRGFRIEPGEVEAVIAEVLGVRNVAVVPRGEGSGLHLVAYVAVDQNSLPDAAALRTAVRERLPEFMVPSTFVRLDSMPLTASGKIDRGALPAPFEVGELTSAAYVPPRSATEIDLSAMVQELLDSKRAGVTDSFFDLGGHSLLATQLLSRINGRWGTAIPLRTVFEHPTIGEIAEAIDAAVVSPQEQVAPIVPVSRDRAKITQSQLTLDGTR